MVRQLIPGLCVAIILCVNHFINVLSPFWDRTLFVCFTAFCDTLIQFRLVRGSDSNLNLIWHLFTLWMQLEFERLMTTWELITQCESWGGHPLSLWLVCSQICGLCTLCFPSFLFVWCGAFVACACTLWWMLCVEMVVGEDRAAGRRAAINWLPSY